MANFTIYNRTQNLPDIQRTHLWELQIVNIGQVVDIGVSNNKLEEDLIIRARSCSIPGRGTETIASNFGAMTQLFAGRPTFERSITVEYEETEEQLISKFLYDWNQAIVDVDPDSDLAGNARYPTKRQMTRTVYLNMYHYGGTPELLERRVKFWNTWPSSVAPVTLNYETSNSVKYSTTFSFDFWTLENT